MHNTNSSPTQACSSDKNTAQLLTVHTTFRMAKNKLRFSSFRGVLQMYILLTSPLGYGLDNFHSIRHRYFELFLVSTKTKSKTLPTFLEDAIL